MDFLQICMVRLNKYQDGPGCSINVKTRSEAHNKSGSYNFACGSVWMSNLVSDIEEHRLKVFENRVLKRIFRLKRDEVTGEW
jgi:hypothetical protein